MPLHLFLARCGVVTDLLRHLDLDLWVVRIGVQHDDRVRQDISDICTLEGIWVATDESLRKLLHEPVNLLCLPRQSEAIQKRPEHQHAIRFADMLAAALICCSLDLKQGKQW